MDAVRELKHLRNSRGGESTRERYYDWCDLVDKAAMEELGRVFAEDADAVYEQLEHQDVSVRCATLKALGNVATKGDERALSAIYSQISSTPRSALSVGIRDSARDAVIKIAHRGDERLIKAAVMHLEYYCSMNFVSGVFDKHDTAKYGQLFREEEY